MDLPLSYEEFKQIYAKVPRLTVEVIIQNEQGLLLTKRNIIPYKGYWHTPGGTVYHGETVEQAVQRIAKNELGVKVGVGKLLGYFEYPTIIEETGFDWPISLAVEVKVLNGEPDAVSQSSEVKFFKQLPEKIIPEQQTFIEKLKLLT